MRKHLKLPVGWRSDGCTGVPDWIFHDCCFAHDKAYTIGGTAADRKRADQQLRKCMTVKVKESKLWVLRWIWFYPRTHIWYAGVRIFGKRHFNYR